MDQSITPDEMNTFRSIPFQKKLQSMETYLIGGPRGKYNMADVAEQVFHDRNYSFTVSLIHRCYNFSGQNGGRYKPGCRFEQAHGYRVTRDDIEAFLRQYPNGTFGSGITFEQFLLTRVQAARSGARQPSAPRPARQAPRPGPDEVSSSPALLKFRVTLLVVMLAALGVLVFLGVTGQLFERMGLSLICAAVAAVSYLAIKKIYF